MNSIQSLSESQSKAARAAGFAFLLSKVIVILSNFGVSFRLIVPSAADTARNIVANETLFRINVASNLVYVVALIVLLSSLYQILGPVNRNLALVASFCWMVLALMWSVVSLNMLGALRLLGNAAYLPVFDTHQLQTLARLYLASAYDAYYIGLPFWGLASTIGAYLFFRSRYIPGLLAGVGVISSVWCVFCAFAFLVFPRFDQTVGAWAFDMPLFLFEMALGLWLLFKGLSPAGPADLETSARSNP